jgi:hypothetical protein
MNTLRGILENLHRSMLRMEDDWPTPMLPIHGVPQLDIFLYCLHCYDPPSEPPLSNLKVRLLADTWYIFYNSPKFVFVVSFSLL